MKANVSLYITSEERALRVPFTFRKRIERYLIDGQSVVMIEGAVELPLDYQPSVLKAEVEVPPPLAEHWGEIAPAPTKIVDIYRWGFTLQFGNIKGRFDEGHLVKLEGEGEKVIDLLNQMLERHERAIEEERRRIAEEEARHLLEIEEARKEELAHELEMLDNFLTSLTTLVEKAKVIDRSNLKEVRALNREIRRSFSPDDDC